MQQPGSLSTLSFAFMQLVPHNSWAQLKYRDAFKDIHSRESYSTGSTMDADHVQADLERITSPDLHAHQKPEVLVAAMIKIDLTGMLPPVR